MQLAHVILSPLTIESRVPPIIQINKLKIPRSFKGDALGLSG